MNHIKNLPSIILIIGLASFFFAPHALARNKISEIDTKPLPRSKNEFDQKYLNKSQPVVFKGAALSWKSSNWSFDFFAQNFSDADVLVQTDEVLTDQDQAVEATYTKTTLKQYIDDIDKKGIDAGYLTQFNLLDINPHLAKDLNFPHFYTYKHLKLINIWIGPKGTKSKLHYDSDHNLFVQIQGKKIITLVSPEQSQNCYPTNVTWYDGYSPIDVFEPDLEKYPLFADVKMLRYELKPGDMLYIPKGWWHDIRSTENSISVNLWWINWINLIRELIGQFKYEYIEGKDFDSKNSYLNTLKRNIGI